MVDSAASLSETALEVVDELVMLQIPDESVINHSFHCFAHTTGQCDGSVAGWVCRRFARFGYGYDSCLLP